ncbi:hypothetical protein WP8W18C01_09460 [Pseudomonas putida]|uniref:Uncharacterized protein n=1 Tax=Pseudomonas putida TaxID=303 RepID=A0A6S5TT53_PSEPU|nr:hypothetical protein WP8W18C01_09460 [Pseudomonas putida]
MGTAAVFSPTNGRKAMRSILLWMIGVPIPVIILIWFFMH